MPEVTESLQDNLRRRLRTALEMHKCPTCGHHPETTMREGSKATGITLASLSRFFRGKNADGSTLDKIYAFLEREKR